MMKDFLCKGKLFQVQYCWTVLMWDFYLWYVDGFPVDYWLWWRVDSYCISHQYHMCCIFLFWIITEERNFFFLYNKTNQMHQFPKFTPAWNSTWEIRASGWFYYKEICYDAWSHERRISSCKFWGFWSGAVADFSSGMLHLVTVCSLPCVLRPYNGLIFKSQVLSDECPVSSELISDRFQSLSLTQGWLKWQLCTVCGRSVHMLKNDKAVSILSALNYVVNVY